MTGLLREYASEGFPSDYLIARIRGRRASLIRDWQPLLATGRHPGTSDETIWRAFLEELDWVYRQMNLRLRRTFATPFALFELKTIVLCLRSRVADNTARVSVLLEHSLLSEPVRKVLSGKADLPSTIDQLGEEMSGASRGYPDLGAAYKDEGLRGLEDGLMRTFLEHASDQKLHPVVRQFFGYFIDLRNIVILYKHLRWKVERRAPFISGGSIETSRFRKILKRNDEAGFDALLTSEMKVETLPHTVGESALESILLRTLTRKLRQAGRESDDVGLILDYVWRVYAQTRNLAVLHHAESVDSHTLERELIL